MFQWRELSTSLPTSAPSPSSYVWLVNRDGTYTALSAVVRANFRLHWPIAAGTERERTTVCHCRRERWHVVLFVRVSRSGGIVWNGLRWRWSRRRRWRNSSVRRMFAVDWVWKGGRQRRISGFGRRNRNYLLICRRFFDQLVAFLRLTAGLLYTTGWVTFTQPRRPL